MPNYFTGVTLTHDTEAAVRQLFSARYKVISVRKGFGGFDGNMYYVHLRDGGQIKVHVAPRFSVFGGDKYYINYVEE